jgi:hypothetical protein
MSMQATLVEKQEEDFINIVRSSEFRVRTIIKFSELRTKYSELSLRDHGLQTHFRARDDPRYGEGFYREEH